MANVCAVRSWTATKGEFDERGHPAMLAHEPVVVTEEIHAKAKEWMATKPALMKDMDRHLLPLGTPILSKFGHLKCRHCGCLYEVEQ